ncbi:MAG: hypothetical protein KatS3mg105_0508 [Gemmatales bacterium]|nr:MAG: hypothetical protein KatS3mg105_0508 [Gemmatales bacterium]
MKRLLMLAVLMLGVVTLVGCVERRFVINSEPAGALVLKNGEPIGTAPADDHFTYYGDYHFTLIKDGYETLHVTQHVPAPWYQYFPLDFFFEVLFPWRIEDVRRYTYQMQPVQAARPDELLNRAAVLRERGRSIPTAQETTNAPAQPGPVFPILNPRRAVSQ